MKSHHLIPALALLCSFAAQAAEPEVTKADDLTISAAWAHATEAGTADGAVYFSIENGGTQLETLLRASSPAAGEAIFHRTTDHDGVEHMEQLWTIDVVAGRTVKFAPGGRHLMLHGLQQPLAAGTRVPLTLHFQHAGDVTLQVHVVSAGAAGPPGSGS